MTIGKSPLRVSFGGGGSDPADYYRQFGGTVIGTTIRIELEGSRIVFHAH